jgi:hypothetical protein
MRSLSALTGLLLMVSPALGAGPGTVMDGSEDSQFLYWAAVPTVARLFPDPYSAQFIMLKTSKTDLKVVCGYVNAKNEGGAYTGFRPFTWSDHDGSATLYDPPFDGFTAAGCELVPEFLPLGLRP